MERGGESEPRNGVRCVLEIINFLEDRSLRDVAYLSSS